MSSRKWEDPSIFQLRLHQIKQELVQRGLSTTGSNKDVISRFRSVLNCEHEDTRRTLNEAVRNQNAETVKRVLSSCIVDAPRSDNNAGLRGHGGTVAVRQLLFVDDYHKADFLNEALHLAVKRGFHDLARELLLEGGDPNLPYSGTPHIVAAAMQGSEKMVEVLIEAGVQLDQEDHSGMCAVYMAVKRGNHDALTVLLTGGADRDACHGDTGRTALMHACSVGNVELASELLRAIPHLGILGANREAREARYGWTPMIFAVRKGHHDTIARLLVNRASLETADHGGWTPVFHAIACDQFETARMLHLAGADLTRRDKNGRSSLMLVVETGNHDMLDMLMASVLSDDDFVPGVRNAHTDKLAEMAVKRLMSFVGATDKEGNNVLHYCAKFGREQMAYELAHEVGVHAEVFNHAKQTPAELAKTLGQRSIAKIFDDQVHSLKTVARSFVRESIYKAQTGGVAGEQGVAGVAHGRISMAHGSSSRRHAAASRTSVAMSSRGSSASFGEGLATASKVGAAPAPASMTTAAASRRASNRGGHRLSHRSSHRASIVHGMKGRRSMRKSMAHGGAKGPGRRRTLLMPVVAESDDV